MNRSTEPAQLALLAVLLLAAPSARADESASASLRFDDKSRLWLEGDSSLHRFKIEATRLSATFVLGAGASEAADPEALVDAHQIASVELRVPVAGLRSGEAAMDENTRRALGAREHPEIVFRLSSYAALPSRPGATGEALRLSGVLSINGVERPVVIDVRATRAGAALHLSGTAPLRMSDFHVVPPRLMGGMLRVADPIVVKLEVNVLRAGLPASAPR